MGGVSVFHWLVLVVIWAVWMVPLAVLFGRTGYSRAWCLVAIVPPLAIVALWVIAFMPWRAPVDRRAPG